MNRKERRRLEQGKGLSKPTWGSKRPQNVTAAAVTIQNSQVAKPSSYSTDFILIAEKINALIDGSASPEDFNFIAFRFNMALHRCRDIDAGLYETMKEVNLKTMQVIANRYLKWGKLQVTKKDKERILLGQNILEEVIKNSSPNQLNKAWLQGTEGATKPNPTS